MTSLQLWCYVVLLAVLVAPAVAETPATMQDSTVCAMRMMRCYGGRNERLPPIVLISSKDRRTLNVDIGSTSVTIEFDLLCSVAPAVYVRFMHCTANWEEEQNAFLNDATLRTTLVDWTLAPSRARYWSHRGSLQVPNDQVQFRFSGNWVAKVYDIGTDELLGETRFFVVEPLANSYMNFMTDFYDTKFKVSGFALTIENVVTDPSATLIDGFMHTSALYRNNRYREPIVVSNQIDDGRNSSEIRTWIGGMAQGSKFFRAERIPSQNEYRVLDMTFVAQFPSTGQPVRLPLTDLRRNGNFMAYGDDGAMITSNISSVDDDYVPIEFLLDPQGPPSESDVFVLGSFNHFRPDPSWQMYYDEELRLYRVRNWVRRARHNYLYATGKLNIDDNSIADLSFEEWEGNSSAANQSFLAFTYYRMQDYGGYDGIIAVCTSSLSNTR